MYWKSSLTSSPTCKLANCSGSYSPGIGPLVAPSTIISPSSLSESLESLDPLLPAAGNLWSCLTILRIPDFGRFPEGRCSREGPGFDEEFLFGIVVT